MDEGWEKAKSVSAEEGLERFQLSQGVDVFRAFPGFYAVMSR